jgi:hypothetical protein
MIKELTFYLTTFGFAAVRILLLFYVLCSKEALARLKPIYFQGLRAINPRRRKPAKLSVPPQEEAVYSSVRLNPAE